MLKKLLWRIDPDNLFKVMNTDSVHSSFVDKHRHEKLPTKSALADTADTTEKTQMNYAIDYSEQMAIGLSWTNGGEPTEFKFTSFFGEVAAREKKKEAAPPDTFEEERFIKDLVSGDTLYLEGIGVNEVLCFLASQRGVEVKRIFAMELKAAREKLGFNKKSGTAKALHQVATKSPELFRAYIPVPPELYLLRRWVRMHFRFQKRFRTGLQATLELLGKEVSEYRYFGHLPDSKSAAKVEDAIKKILEAAEALEQGFLHEVEHALKGFPFWEKVLAPIKGIGPRIGSKIVASGPRARFANRDHFVAAAGFHVRNGEAAHRVAGEVLKRDAFLWDAVLQFTRRLGCHEGEWTDRYKESKARYLEKFSGDQHAKKHADSAARRKVGTKLLRRIWREWTEIEP